MTAIYEATTQRMPRYTVTGRLGAGGFATVERAHDQARGVDVALKTLLPQRADDAEVRRRFLTEARLLTTLRHPNLVTAYEVGDTGSLPFFTMELIAGRTLAQAIPAGLSLPLAEVGRIMTGLCAAVDFLHDHGLVHRDITPSNVMLGADGRVVLMDLGIARSITETTTGDKGLIGTPESIAPEQVAGLPAGPEADIYALGVLAYRLLCGRPPFSGEVGHVLHAQIYDQPLPLQQVRPGLPEPVYQAVAAALAKDPAQRPARAHELAAVLCLLPDATTRRSTQRMLAPAPRSGQIRPVRAPSVRGGIFAPALVALLVLAGGWWALRSSRGLEAGPAEVTNLRALDNVFTANEGRFVAGASVAGCMVARPGTRNEPLTMVVTGAGALPDRAVFGRSRPVPAGAAPACVEVPLSSRPLMPGDYRLWVLQGTTALASAPFTVLPPP